MRRPVRSRQGLPSEACDALEEAADCPAAARITTAEHLLETFGSVCDREHLYARDAGDLCSSRCVRHDDEYEDVVAVIDRRHGG